MSQPSTFATLLRRSKFASYDPAITQIYTAPAAHAHRGDFGFKRPLPRIARKRSSAIVVTSADTREYQTEWADADQQAKFVQRLDESGASWKHMEPWKHQARSASWAVDSEFDTTPKGREMGPAVDGASYNYLSPKEFKHLVKKSRGLRGEFYQFLEQTRERQNAEVVKAMNDTVEHNQTLGIKTPTEKLREQALEHEPTNMYTTAQLNGLSRENQTKAGLQAKYYRAINAPRQFLAERERAALQSPPSSLALAPMPHPHAGLSYSHNSQLQNVLTSPPIPGWVLPQANYRDGFMAPLPTPPPSSTPGEPNRSRALPQNVIPVPKMNYVAHIGGSWAAAVKPAEIASGVNGNEEGTRPAPFSFFPRSSRSDEDGKKEQNAMGTFRQDPNAPNLIMDPPTVVHSSRPAGSTEDHLTPEAKLRAFKIDRSIAMSVVPSQAFEFKNPHAVGTNEYASASEGKKGKKMAYSYALNTPGGGSGVKGAQKTSWSADERRSSNTNKLLKGLESLLVKSKGQGASRRD